MNSETKKSSSTKDEKKNLSNTLLKAYIKYYDREDNCYERLIFTAFLEEYMMTTKEGKKRVEEYYKIAPKLVEAIENSDKRDICYLYLNEVMHKCVAYGERGLYGYVENAFRIMVKNFKKEFNL